MKACPTIIKALKTLDRSLAVASWLSAEETFFLPKDLKQNWLFLYRQIALSIPEMEQYDVTLIERVLRRNGIACISQELLEIVVVNWIWTFINSLSFETLQWCSRVMKDCSDPELVELYLDVASSHWLSFNIPSRLIDYVLITTKMITPRRAISLLEKRERAKANLDSLRRSTYFISLYRNSSFLYEE